MKRHRGPDDEGFFVEPGVGLAMRRLSIVDLECSRQPISNEDGAIHLVFNGEIYNYVELRADLERRGHRLSRTFQSAGAECRARCLWHQARSFLS